MKSDPKVSVIIVNWNGKRLLRDCLNSIERTEYSNFDVVVVDNGSNDGSVEMIRNEFQWVDIILNEANLGFVKANNIGIKHALKKGADYVFWLNNDTKILDKNWLKSLVQVAESDSRIGIVGCKLVFPSGKVQSAGGYLDCRSFHHYTDGNRTAKVDYVVGAAFLVKREVINKIGLIDEEFSPGNFEELDYCMRARAAGYWTVYTPRVVIVHIAGATFGKTSWPTPATYKNGIRFYMLNYPASWIMTANLFIILSVFFKRKDKRYRMGPRNIKLKEDWILRIKSLINAYLVNILNSPKTLHKRHNRIEKVWN